MAHKNTPAEELYEVAVLLLAVVKSMRRNIGGPWAEADALIRRAEKATKVRPK